MKRNIYNFVGDIVSFLSSRPGSVGLIARKCNLSHPYANRIIIAMRDQELLTVLNIVGGKEVYTLSAKGLQYHHHYQLLDKMLPEVLE